MERPTARTSFFQSCFGVFQGGGCRGAAYAGAFKAATDRGVHFSEVAGSSAGSIAAALIGAGATPSKFTELLSNLDFRQFIGPPDMRLPSKPGRLLTFALRRTRYRAYASLLTHGGLHSSRSLEVWMEHQLQQLLPNAPRPIRFKSLVLPTWIVSLDLKSKEVKVWSTRTTPDDEVARAVRASSSIPVFFQPVEWQFVDGGAVSNLPAFVFSDLEHKRLSRRILAFVLQSEEPPETEYTTAIELLLSGVLGGVLEGGQALQLRMQPDVHVIRIPTGTIKATDFDKMTSESVGFLIKQGEDATDAFFDNELARVHPFESQLTRYNDREEAYAAIAEAMDGAIKDVLIVEATTDWVFALFPCILSWRMRGVCMRVLLSKTQDDPTDGPYRRALLRGLGAQVTEVENIPFQAWVVNGNDPNAAWAIARPILQSQENKVFGKRYSAPLDAAAINALRNGVEGMLEASGDTAWMPQFAPQEADRLLQRLRSVRQYAPAQVQLSMETVGTDSLMALSDVVREFKYRQAGRLAELYATEQLAPFEPAKVILARDNTTMITPPVVEQSGSNFVLIEGSSRATYCRDNGIDQIRCVVVRGVTDALPGVPLPLSAINVVGSELHVTKRYGEKFNYDRFRHIERSVHTLDDVS